MVENLPDIYEFTHFRKFLEEYQERRFTIDPSFTKVAICGLLDLPQTRSYFTDILRGKKVSPRMVSKISEVLELDRKATQYFAAMVKFDQAKNELARSEAMEELLRIHPRPQSLLHSDSYEYYAKWYHSAIFAILDVIDTGEDVTPIAKRMFPKVTPKKISESLDLLARLKLIRKNDHGCWKPTREAISSGPYNNDDLIRQYQLQCFELSKQALLTPSQQSHVMSTMVFSLSNAAYQELEEELQAFKTKARKIISADKKKPESVYHMNLHLFSNLDAEAK